MQKVTVVIPTYWTWPTDIKSKKESFIFDHPTPLDLDGTLARTLESFRKINYPNFNILVITASTNVEIEGRVEKRVQGIIDKFKDKFEIKHFSYSKLQILRERLFELGHYKILQEIDLENYNNIRNLQLIVSYINNSDVVVGIDDDEVINDSNYLYKAAEYVGKEYKGDFIAGVAGYYLDREGNHRLKVEGQKKYDDLNNIDIEELMPYPGSFFEDKVFSDAEKKLAKVLSDKNIAETEPEKEAREFINYAKERAKRLVPEYFKFRLLWKDMIKDIKNDQKLREAII